MTTDLSRIISAVNSENEADECIDDISCRCKFVMCSRLLYPGIFSKNKITTVSDKSAAAPAAVHKNYHKDQQNITYENITKCILN